MANKETNVWKPLEFWFLTEQLEPYKGRWGVDDNDRVHWNEQIKKAIQWRAFKIDGKDCVSPDFEDGTSVVLLLENQEPVTTVTIDFSPDIARTAPFVTSPIHQNSSDCN